MPMEQHQFTLVENLRDFMYRSVPEKSGTHTACKGNDTSKSIRKVQILLPSLNEANHSIEGRVAKSSYHDLP